MVLCVKRPRGPFSIYGRVRYRPVGEDFTYVMSSFVGWDRAQPFTNAVFVSNGNNTEQAFTEFHSNVVFSSELRDCMNLRRSA